MHFWRIEDISDGEINERSFSNPTRCNSMFHTLQVDTSVGDHCLKYLTCLELNDIYGNIDVILRLDSTAKTFGTTKIRHQIRHFCIESMSNWGWLDALSFQSWLTHPIYQANNKERNYTFNILRLNIYRHTSDIRRTLVVKQIVDHSDVVGAVGAATTSSFST